MLCVLPGPVPKHRVNCTHDCQTVVQLVSKYHNREIPPLSSPQVQKPEQSLTFVLLNTLHRCSLLFCFKDVYGNKLSHDAVDLCLNYAKTQTF